MATLLIPVPGGTDAFTEQVELEGVIYELLFRWNARDGHWFLDVSSAGALLLAGLKLVVSGDLLFSARRIDGLPPGKLLVVDLDGRDRDPDGALFGDRVQLRYEESSGA